MSWIKYFKDFFLILVVSVFLLVFLNALSIVVYDLYKSYFSSDYYAFLPEVVQKNYSHLGKDDVNQLLDETWKPGWTYEEVIGFKEKPRQGKYVNVNSYGFRTTADGEEFRKRLNGAVWFFGGSTTFGYGVGDTETIPHILGELLDDNVVNLGRGSYYSLQENLLLQSLLNSGLKPSRVVFLDGINERCSIKMYQKEMEVLFSEAQKSVISLTDYTLSLAKPLLNLLPKVFLKLGLSSVKNTQSENLQANKCAAFGGEIKLPQVLQANLDSRNLMCDFYKVKCNTFLQPFAGVHGTHLSYKDLTKEGRSAFTNQFNNLKDIFISNGVEDITAALDGYKEHAFIDGAHYSYEANKILAQELHSTLVKQP